MSDDSQAFERFVLLAKREFQAEDVRLLGAGEVVPDAENVLVTRLPDGRHVVASFAEAPKEREALTRRLTILVNTFSGALASPSSEHLRSRPPPASSLHEALKALSARSQAVDVVVIDTDSPVVWGRARVPSQPIARSDLLLRDVSDRELASQIEDESGPFQDLGASPPPPEVEDDVVREAIAAVRRLPALDALHKGRHLRHVERESTFFLVMSFSGIYLLVLVFEGAFDELRAERAAVEALPRIERLVLALPPLDPEPPQPMGGVVALRRPRRR